MRILSISCIGVFNSLSRDIRRDGRRGWKGGVIVNISEIETTKYNTHWIVFERFLEKQIAQNFVAVFGQFVLLLLAAMVLEAKNDRIFRRDERCVPHRVNHVLEENVGAHSFAMRNYRLLVLPFAIPTIQLDAPSSHHAF